MRWLPVFVLCALATWGAPRKPAPRAAPKAPACDAFATCLQAIDLAFEATDFERAQRLARQAERFAGSGAEKAQLLVLQGALEVQANPGAPEGEATAKARFTEAQRLDPALTLLAIPAYARSDRLETLWKEAQPEIKQLAPAQPEVAPQLVTIVPPIVQPRRFPLITFSLGAAAVVAAGTGTVFGLLSRGSVEQRDRALLDLYRYQLTQTAQTQATVANVAFITAGTIALSALLTWLFFE